MLGIVSIAAAKYGPGTLAPAEQEQNLRRQAILAAAEQGSLTRGICAIVFPSRTFVTDDDAPLSSDDRALIPDRDER